MVELDDGSLLVSSYAWMVVPDEAVNQGEQPMHTVFGWPFTFLGGYLMRSVDGAATWQGPILPPQTADQTTYFGDIPIPAMNRGAMVQASDGRLYWAVATNPRQQPGRTVLDLMVSDITMPGMDGIRLLERTKQIRPKMPVIILTAFASNERMAEVMRKGAFDCLTKPVLFDDLLDCVDRAASCGD